MKADSHSSENSTSYDIKNPPYHPHKVNDIIKTLDKLLDTMKKNHSIISKLSESWGNLPVWMKISGGLLVLGSLLIIGILTLSTLLIATTCVCTVFYTLISLGLDNHYTTNKNEHFKLKSAIASLGNILSLIIEKLHESSVKLSTEVDRLSALLVQARSDFESELSGLVEVGETLQKNNEILAQIVKSMALQFTQHNQSNKAFEDSLERHLEGIAEGKETFFQAVGNIVNLEKALEASQQRNQSLVDQYRLVLHQYETLFEKYEALVTQHEDKHAQENLRPYAAQLLRGIIGPVNENPSVASSQQPLTFQQT